MTKKFGLPGILIFLSLFSLIGCANNALLIRPVSSQQQLKETRIYRDQGLFVSDKIVIIDIDGVLANNAAAGLLQSGENPVSLFQEKLDKARSDKNVKAVIIRINSPGGTVVASDLMYHALQTFKESTELPVIACILDVGASGAYYLACACDTIIATPSSTVGSIGTIMQTVNLAGIMFKLGISTEAIKSGELKDMGTPFRSLKAEERKVLTDIIMHHYNTFVDVIHQNRQNRGLTRDQILQLADGRVYTSDQVLENKLIDQIGYPDDAIELAQERAGITSAHIVIYRRPIGYKPNYYASAASLNPPASLINLEIPFWLRAEGPQFLYLWQVGDY